MSDVTLNEGGTATSMVSLSLADSTKAPTSNVILNLASDNTDVTYSPSSLTFSRTNYATAQSVTVSAAQDSDTSVIV